MPTTPTVDVVGLRALVRDITRLSEDTSGPLLNALKAAGRSAAEPVAEHTRERVPNVSGALMGDIRVTAARTGATVRMGRSSVPYAAPVDFGGWPPGRPHVQAGRYLYPAASALREVAAQLYSDACARVFDTPGIWTNTTSEPEAVHD